MADIALLSSTLLYLIEVDVMFARRMFHSRAFTVVTIFHRYDSGLPRSAQCYRQWMISFLISQLQLHLILMSIMASAEPTSKSQVLQCLSVLQFPSFVVEEYSNIFILSLFFSLQILRILWRSTTLSRYFIYSFMHAYFILSIFTHFSLSRLFACFCS